MDCSCDALYGDTGLMAPGALIDAKICWHDKCQHAAEGRWIKCSGLQLHWAEECPRWELIGRRVCRRLSTGYRSR
jgi:hypothetical protein